MHILKCAVGGAAFAAAAVLSGSVTWTLVQRRQDEKRCAPAMQAA